MLRSTITLLLITFLPSRGCTRYDLQLPLPRYDFSNDLKMQTAINSEIDKYKETLNRNIEASKSNLLEAGLTIPKYENIVYTTPSSFDLRDNKQSSIKPKYRTSNYNQRNETQMETKTIISCAPPAKSTTESIKNNEICEIVEPLSPKNFIGTNLFSSHKKKCFMPEDIILLANRLDFEILVPKTQTTGLLNSKTVSVLMRHFNKISNMIDAIAEENSQQKVQQVFYDILGGFLHYYLLPTAKLSFYADNLKLQTVKTIIQMYEVCKIALNTNGNGWRAPKRDMLDIMQNVDISQFIVDYRISSVSVTSCGLLDLHSNNKLNEHMIVALPKLEPPGPDGFLSNICLPFKNRRIFNLLTPKCSCIFLKFYRVVTRCYQFQRISQDTYNKKLINWIVINLGKHFDDDKFYPGLGGVLRLYESLRRNISDIIDDEDSEDGCGIEDKGYVDSSEPESDFDASIPTDDSLVATEKRSRSANFIDEVINVKDSNSKMNETNKSPDLETVCSPCDKEFENDEDDQKIEATSKAILRNKAKKPEKHIHYRDNFISFIKIFLALMLLLLLCILCSCLCNSSRSKSKSKVNYIRSEPVKQSVGEQSKPTNAPCCGLFQSRKRARERMNAMYIRSEVGPMSIDNTTRRSDNLSLTSISSLRFQPKKKMLPLSKSTSSKQTSEYSSSPKKNRRITYRHGNKLMGVKTNFLKIDEKCIPKQRNYLIDESASSATVSKKQKVENLEAELDAIQSLPKQRSAWIRFKKALPKRVRSVSPTRVPSTISYYYSSSEKEKRHRQKGGEDFQDGQNTGSWETTLTSG